MALFQQSVIKQYISRLDENKLQHGWNHFESYFKDNAQQQIINESKEEEFQVLFLTNLFDKCLGFNIDGINRNLFIEFKNVTDSKTADGAIKINDEVVAVIELKSTKTKDFNKIQEQAFGYKVSHPNCKYVVTSNFNKLRFYIENTTAFEEFDLFNLTYERFKLLWLCLSFESVSSGIPLKIKSESTLNEENITKKLYKDYSLFRKEIFNDIVEKNQQYDKLTLFNKTQKLLDRFLFIFFAEDRRLLPVNSISKIIEKWEDDIAYGDEKSLYTSFKLYFNLLNKGRPASAKREEIFAYNGGLFAPDDTLDSISIDDKLLSKHTKKLSTYDFESDVSVNILGHIFEHSLSEIEEIQNEITGVETDKTSSKRKKDGVFYTPSYITKYIVENTVGKLCQQKKEELEINEEVYTQRKARSKKRIDNLDAYRNWLLEITICDPACGSGAFLVQALDFLIEEHKYIDKLNAAYHGASIPFSDITSSILENNLYGVDINGESVEIAKLSLWLRTAQKGRKLTSLNSNLKCGNSLIDDPEVAGDKAFNWEKEFPEVFGNGGFDVVIGNPPYVQLQKLKEISKQLKKFNYETYESTGDLYCLFYEKGNKVLKNNGLLGYITSNKWMRANYGKSLRNYFIENTTPYQLIDLGAGIFKTAVVDSNIILFENKKSTSLQIPSLNISNEQEVYDFDSFKNKFVNINPLNDEVWAISSKNEQNLKAKVEKNGTPLKDWDITINRGVLTGLTDAFIIEESQRALIIKENSKSEELIKPVLRGRDVKRYKIDYQKLYIINTHNGYGTTPRIDIEYYPAIKKYLEKFEPKLSERYDKGDTPFNLRNCAYIEAFNQPKIIWKEMSSESPFALDKNGYFTNDTITFIVGNNLEYLLCLLNSKLSFYVYSNYYAGGGLGSKGVRFKKDFLSELPIKNILISDQKPFVEKTNQILAKNKELQLLEKTIINQLQSKFKIFNFSIKLQNWYELDFGNFLKELEKARKKSAKESYTEYTKLSLSEEAEWMQYFNEQKQKAEELKLEIDKIDNEIDQMVYELYGLTQEEIEVVENATKI